MNFDEAYQQMRKGKAVARPGWQSIAYLFFERECVWAQYHNNALRPLPFFTGSNLAALDWFVVDVTALPVLPPASKKQTSGVRRFLGDRLAAKQEKMRAQGWKRVRAAKRMEV